MEPKAPGYELAFVLGGGGVLGAHEVGMLRALAERDVRPDVVLGTSVGAINGAFFAANPTLEGVERLSEMRERLVSLLPVRRVEDLQVPFQCVAASIERAAEHWFDSGPLAEVVL